MMRTAGKAMAECIFAVAAIGSAFCAYADGVSEQSRRIVYVMPKDSADVTPTSPYGSWETAAASIGDALSSVNGEATVFVAPGIYVPDSKLTIGAGIVVQSLNPETNEPDPDNTVIDGSGIGGNDCTVELAGGRFVGFTVRNCGSAENKCGTIRIRGGETSSGALVADCTMTNNVADCGGGIFMDKPNYAVVSNCTFSGNLAHRGGGMYYWPPKVGEATGVPCIVNCRFAGNGMLKEWSDGPAVYAGACLFNGCVFDGNVATYPDKGYASCIYPCGDDPCNTMTFSRCVFKNHEKSVFNPAINGKMSIEFRHCEFTGNGGVLQGDNEPSLLLDGCVISNNACGILIEGSPTMRNCLVVDNGTNTASVVVKTKSAHAVVLDNCTVVSSVGYVVMGNAAGGHAVVRNSILLGSDRPAWATWRNGCWLYATNSVMNLETGIFASDDPGCANNVVNVDPLFASAADGNWSLTKKSPCCNAGILLNWMDVASVDIVGFPRVYGDLPDIGCYESDRRKYGFGIVVR